MTVVTLSDLPADIRRRAEAVLSGEASFVHVEHDVSLFGDETDRYGVYALQGDRFVSMSFGRLTDGGIRENTDGLLRSQIVNVEIKGNVGSSDELATIHVVDHEAGNGSTYSTGVPLNVGRALIRAG